MYTGEHIPLVRLVIPLMVGIIVFLLAGIAFSVEIFLIAYFLLGLVAFLIKRFFSSVYLRRWIFGAWIFLFLFIAGYHISQNHRQINHPLHFSHFSNAGGRLLLRVREPVSEKANSWQVIAEVEHIISDSVNLQLMGKLMLYLEKDSLAAKLRYGDLLLIENEFHELQAPLNSGEFNYKRFLAMRNIYHQSWRASGNWFKTGENTGFSIMRHALSLREKTLQIFQQRGLENKEFAVVSALVLGYREYLDEDLQREFSGSGAMHILCVSGLHVGIIYLILRWLLTNLLRLRSDRALQICLILPMLWFYAAMTGFSPPVLRATIMFSFLSVGLGLGRRTNIYNNLAASALLLMLIDPFIIAGVGFQMSYLAVISIVAIQPVLYKKFEISNPLLDKIWALICVTLAAQVATSPLSLYYFHQFPSFFLITNLIVVPLASVAIYSALGALIFASVPLLGDLTIKVLYGLIFIMHRSVHFIDSLPLSTLKGLYISMPEMLGLFIILGFLALFFIYRNQKVLFLALFSILILVSSLSIRRIKNLQQRSMVVYYVNRCGVIDFFQGKKAVSLVFDTRDDLNQHTDYQIRGNRLKCGIRAVIPLQAAVKDTLFYQECHFSKKGSFVRFENKHLFLLDKDCPEVLPKPGFTIDYLVVSHNPRHKPTEVLKCFQPQMVIVDGSNYYRTTHLWEEACKAAETSIWPVQTKGAFLVSIK